MQLAASIVQLCELCTQKGIPFFEKEELAKHCTFCIGGSAQVFIQPAAIEQVQHVVAFVTEHNLPLLTLGKGSNILFYDEGFEGVVLQLGERFAAMQLVDDTTIYCLSGAKLTDLCRFAQENGLTGMEPLFGIPGSVGGAIFMNAGAYGGETRQVLRSATHVTLTGEAGQLEGDALEQRYRHSAYVDSGAIITGGFFQLARGDKDEILSKMNDFMGRRRDKQPLEYPSAGSTFKRPEGHYASALIDECGLKGHRVGGAEVSKKHAGFIINAENATSKDVRNLIKEIQQEVYRQTQVTLEPEIRLIPPKEGCEWTY